MSRAPWIVQGLLAPLLLFASGVKLATMQVLASRP